MCIISLFCETHDFFLAYEKWQALHCVPSKHPQKAADVGEGCIRSWQSLRR